MRKDRRLFSILKTNNQENDEASLDNVLGELKSVDSVEHIHNLSTPDIFGVLRNLSFANSKAAKGYRPITFEENQRNSKIYTQRKMVNSVLKNNFEHRNSVITQELSKFALVC